MRPSLFIALTESQMNNVALICGISEQDSTLLEQLLLTKGYEARGTSRYAKGSNIPDLLRLGIRDRI